MFKFIYIDDENEDGVAQHMIEHTVNTDSWPTLVEHFNMFLAGCSFIPHYPMDEFSFCEPKRNEDF